MEESYPREATSYGLHVLQGFSPLDYFLLEYCKENVHTNTPLCAPEFQRAIESFVSNIPSATCEQIIVNFKRRITECIKQNEDNIDHRNYFSISYNEM